MKTFCAILASIACVLAFTRETVAQDVRQRIVDVPMELAKSSPYMIWPSRAPASCPFKQSAEIIGVGFTGRHAEYTDADTWYPTWASDGNLYSPFADGKAGDVTCASAGTDAATGNAKIVGDDPLKLKVIDVGSFKSDPSPYAGRYPCGSLVYDGVWYYGTYCLHPSPTLMKDGVDYNWPWMGPFVGFRWSKDFGKSWTQTPCTPEHPLFGETALNGEPIKVGAPHFVDFGKNLEHSPDGKAYLVAHGASDGANRRYGFDSWITGDEIYLARVVPSVETINDASQYEFFDGDAWSKKFAKIKPIAAWRDNMGCVTMTYDAPLKKYLMCVTDGGNTVSKYNTYVLESDHVAGPWKLISYFEHFGQQAYFVNIPSKFVSADGRTAWLCFAANFTNGYLATGYRSDPPGGRYGMCLQEIRLFGSTDSMPAPGPLDSEENLAREATVTTGFVCADSAVSKTTTGDSPDSTLREWAKKSESAIGTIGLTWRQEQTVDRVWLFDRHNDLDQIQSGILLFSDGTTIKTGALSDVTTKGLEIQFAPKTIKWVIFGVQESGSQNIGLAELAVFRRST